MQHSYLAGPQSFHLLHQVDWEKFALQKEKHDSDSDCESQLFFTVFATYSLRMLCELSSLALFQFKNCCQSLPIVSAWKEAVGRKDVWALVETNGHATAMTLVRIPTSEYCWDSNTEDYTTQFRLVMIVKIRVAYQKRRERPAYLWSLGIEESQLVIFWNVAHCRSGAQEKTWLELWKWRHHASKDWLISLCQRTALSCVSIQFLGHASAAPMMLLLLLQESVVAVWYLFWPAKTFRYQTAAPTRSVFQQGVGGVALCMLLKIPLRTVWLCSAMLMQRHF